MTYKTVPVTLDGISLAINLIFDSQNQSIDEVLDYLTSQKHRAPIWFDVARIIVGERKSARTIATYTNKCCKAFNRGKIAITQSLVEIGFRRKENDIKHVKVDEKEFRTHCNVDKVKNDTKIQKPIVGDDFSCQPIAAENYDYHIKISSACDENNNNHDDECDFTTPEIQEHTSDVDFDNCKRVILFDENQQYYTGMEANDHVERKLTLNESSESPGPSDRFENKIINSESDFYEDPSLKYTPFKFQGKEETVPTRKSERIASKKIGFIEKIDSVKKLESNYLIARKSHTFGNGNVQKKSKSNKQKICNVIKTVVLDSNFYKSVDGGFSLRYKNKSWPIIGPRFIVPKEFWEKYWNGHAKSLLYTWTKAFHKFFNKTEDFKGCVLKFHWHNCAENSSTNVFFNAEAECKNSACTRFKFIVEKKIDKNFGDCEVMVFQKKVIAHKDNEIYTRDITGDERLQLGEKLQAKTPKKLSWEMLSAKSDDVLEAGNFIDAPHCTTLQKINSDYRKRNDLDPDFDVFMKKLFAHFNYGTVIRGYLQYYALQPLIIILFTQQQLEYLAKQKDIFLHLDATGAVAAQPPYSNEFMTIYYYALVLPGSENLSPLQVLEAYMSIHTETAVQFMLRYFLDNLKLICASKQIRKLQVDFSLVMLKSGCTALNKMNLMDYIRLIYQETEKEKKLNATLVILHVCSSHMIKTVRRKVIKLFPNKKDQKNQRFAASNLFSEMLHSPNIESTIVPFTLLVILYGSEYKAHNFDELLSGKVDDNGFTKDSEEACCQKLPEDCLEDGVEKVKSSPYYAIFSDLKDDILQRNMFSTEKNPFYKVEFVDYLINHIMPYFALWSAAGIARFGLARASNATAENFMKIYKHTVLNGEKKNPIPRLILKTEESLQQSMKERKYLPITSRRASNSSMRSENQKEQPKAKRTKKRKLTIEPKKGGKKPRVEKWKRNRYFPDSPRLPDDDDFESESENDNDIIENMNKSESASVSDNIKSMCDMYDSMKKTAQSIRKLEKRSSRKKKKETSLQDEKESDSSTAEAELIKQHDALTYNNLTTTSQQISFDNSISNKSNKSFYRNLEDANVLFTKNANYPIGFPNWSNTINGYYISKIGFNTLFPYNNIDQWLDDSVINSFFSLLPDISKKKLRMSLLCFDTYFYDKIFTDRSISEGFIKWAFKEKVMKKNVWLIPINVSLHWVLLVVIIDQCALIYFDSLLNDPKDNIIDAICTFIQNENGSDINWENWTLYVPKDIPSQILTSRENPVGGNCGVHVCVRGLILATNSHLNYTEAEMDLARIAIANILAYSKKDGKILPKRVENRRLQYLDKDVIDMKKRILPLSGKINVLRKPPLNFDRTQDFSSSFHILFEPGKVTRLTK